MPVGTLASGSTCHPASFQSSEIEASAVHTQGHPPDLKRRPRHATGRLLAGLGVSSGDPTVPPSWRDKSDPPRSLKVRPDAFGLYVADPKPDAAVVGASGLHRVFPVDAPNPWRAANPVKSRSASRLECASMRVAAYLVR